jgi:hypothetical protein
MERGYAGMQFNAVVETNKSAVELYLRHGFTVIGTVPGPSRIRRWVVSVCTSCTALSGANPGRTFSATSGSRNRTESGMSGKSIELDRWLTYAGGAGQPGGKGWVRLSPRGFKKARK